MIRILHLLDSNADFQTRRSAEQLSRELGGGFEAEMKTVGRGGDYRSMIAAARDLRGLIEFDVVHAWGLKALTAAAVSARARIVFSPEVGMSGRGAGWVRAIGGYREVETIVSTATLRKALVRSGVALERCHLVRPGVDFGRVKRRKSPELRAALGLGEKDYVLLACGESTKAAGHGDAVWPASILHVLDPKYKLLLWGRGPEIGRVREFGRRLGNADLIRVAEERLGKRVEFEELLPATDMVLVSARGAVATLPIAIAMAAALPIVLTVTYTTSELLEDRHTALLVGQRRPRVVAQKILALREDFNLQWSLSDMARTEAYEYFTLTRFLNQYRGVYRQVAAGQRAEVVEPGPGAGRRFHGRG